METPQQRYVWDTAVSRWPTGEARMTKSRRLRINDDKEDLITGALKAVKLSPALREKRRNGKAKKIVSSTATRRMADLYAEQYSIVGAERGQQDSGGIGERMVQV